MNAKTPIVNDAGEVRTLTAEDLVQFRPAAEVLPADWIAQFNLPKRRGPQKAPTKAATTNRLSPEVIAAFKTHRPGCQTPIDLALTDWLRTHSPA